MAANGKPSKKIIFSGGVVARSGIGRLHPVITGCYLTPEFNGGISASNLKAPVSAACPFRPVKKSGCGHSPRAIENEKLPYVLQRQSSDIEGGCAAGTHIDRG
jgi:hypothetical protein